jgi:hypothetical protein
MLRRGSDVAEAAKRDLAHRRDVRLGIIALLLFGALVSLASCRSELRGVLESDSSQVIGGGRLVAGSASFRISGSTVEPISPGVTVPLDLRISNRHSVTLSVTSLAVAMGGVTAPNADAQRPCSVADFALVQAHGSFHLKLPAHSTKALGELGIDRATWPRVGMVDRPVNQDGCKGASLTLSYTGSGTLGN